METKTCTICREVKSLGEFYNSKRSKDGRGYRCKLCDSEARQRNRDKNTEGTKLGYRRRHILYHYNITLEQYDIMLKSQNYSCAICGTTNPAGEGNTSNDRLLSFAVDHCHDTGVVRGLLCNPCNRGLGFFKDSSSILKKALDYMQCH